jgi:S-adenosylmethionine hydrolase
MKTTNIAALLTDFGALDPYVGIVKGVIKSLSPRASLIDLAHEILPQDVRSAAFHLMVSVPYFPDGTLFVAVVDPGVGSSRAVLYAETARHRYLAPDNGLLSWVFRKQPPRVLRSVENDALFLSPVSRTFQGRDVFAPVAGHLLGGMKSKRLGPPYQMKTRIPFPEPVRSKNKIQGEVLVVDRFGNLISNIGEREMRGRRLRVRVGRSKMLPLCPSYSEGPDKAPFVVRGSFGFLEVAVKNGNAAERLKACVGDELSAEVSS